MKNEIRNRNIYCIENKVIEKGKKRNGNGKEKSIDKIGRSEVEKNGNRKRMFWIGKDMRELIKKKIRVIGKKKEKMIEVIFKNVGKRKRKIEEEIRIMIENGKEKDGIVRSKSEISIMEENDIEILGEKNMNSIGEVRCDVILMERIVKRIKKRKKIERRKVDIEEELEGEDNEEEKRRKEEECELGKRNMRERIVRNVKKIENRIDKIERVREIDRKKRKLLGGGCERKFKMRKLSMEIVLNNVEEE